MPAPPRKPSPFLKAGLPLVLFCCVGYLGLTTFLSGRYSGDDKRVVSKSARKAELEELHKKVMSDLALDKRELQLKPIHRPPDA
jgi:hypothetical protein